MDNNVKKSNKGVYTIIVILCMLVLGLGGFIVYDKFIKKEDKKEAECNCTECKASVNEVKKCSGYIEGEYYGEENKVYDNGLELHAKAHYFFKKDGTFSYYYENSEGNNGTYEIVDGKIYAEVGEEYANPESHNKTYILTYNISGDCSTITIDDLVLKKK